MLTETGKRKISDMIASAEQKTSGEVRVAWFGASDDYASSEERLGVIGIFVVALAWFAFATGTLGSMLVLLVALPAGYAFGKLGLARLPWLRRWATPQRKMEETVHARAIQAFHDNGLSATAERNGILIFVSGFERMVDILADKGINDRVTEEDKKSWERMCAVICEGIRKGDADTVLAWAAWRCGNMLAKHFPRKADDVNELSDEVITD